MALDITLKHYTDTNDAADEPTITLVSSNSNGRLFGLVNPLSVHWPGVTHAFEVTVTCNVDTLVGCEVLALACGVQNIRQDLL
jgi:hypothetical protein